MVRSFRLRPVGWQHESYRHYLASKGISTSVRRDNREYFKRLKRFGYTKEIFIDAKTGEIFAGTNGVGKGDQKKGMKKPKEIEEVDDVRNYLVRKSYFAGKGNFLPSHYHSAFASGLNREEYEKRLRDEGRGDLIQTERKETPEFVRAIKEAPVEFTKARPSEQLEEERLPVVGDEARVAEGEEEERPGRRKYGVFSDNLSPGVPPSGFFSGERLE